MKKNLFFIVAYNHENFIESVVKRIPQHLLKDPDNEVLIFDDASKDSTFEKSQKLSTMFEGGAKLNVLKNPANQGYGGNQKLGYRYAIDHGYEQVFLIHGDGQYAPESLPELIKVYENNKDAGAVFGTRMANWKSPLKGGMPVYKFIGNKILTVIQNALLGSKMSEFHSGMRSYSTELLKRIPFECNSNDYHFDTEIIIQCVGAKSHPIEVPIPTHYGEEECHVNGMKYAKDILLACLHHKFFKAGFLYDPKFDVSSKERVHPADEGINSQLVNEIPNAAKILLIGAHDEKLNIELNKKMIDFDELNILQTKAMSGPFRTLTPANLDENLAKAKTMISENNYEYIVLPQTLEHFSSPESILSLIRENYPAELQPTVIATTSNVGFFVVRIMLLFGQFNYGVGGILDRNHARLFSKGVFIKLFSQYSFKVNKFSGAALPSNTIEDVFPTLGILAKITKGLMNMLAKALPSLFSYRMLIRAQPLPSVKQLLSDAKQHSQKLSNEIQKTSVSSEPSVPL